MSNHRTLVPVIFGSIDGVIACQRVWRWLFEAFIREVSLSGMSRSPDLSLFRIRVIMDSLLSTKNYFDTFLAIPLCRIPGLPSIHWALLGYTILLAATMSLSIQTPEWNITTAHTIIQLEDYLEAICSRVRDLSSETSPSETLADWYANLVESWGNIKSRYLAALQQQSETGAEAPSTDSQPATSQHTESNDQAFAPHVPASAQCWMDPCQPHPTDNTFRYSGGFELFDCMANTGSWLFPDFEFSQRGMPDF